MFESITQEGYIAIGIAICLWTILWLLLIFGIKRKPKEEA